MDGRAPESTPAVGTADAPAPGWIFAHRHFNRLLLGALAGTLGDRLYQIAAIAAVMAVFAEDPSSAIAWITLAGVLPQLVLYPLIGKLVDSFDRRRILWGTFALKLPVIWLFVPILVQAPGPFREHWWQLLPLVFVLSLFTVAFGPARASAIPDVVPGPRIGIAASLLAVTGLFSILVGSLLGMVIAEKSGAVFERATGKPLAGEYGPVCVIVLAALLFAAALWLLYRLPDAVAVPGTQRQEAGAGGAASGGGYLAQTWLGLKYCVTRRGVMALMLFEAAFWVCAVAFYNLNAWHAPQILHVPESARRIYFGACLACAGLGLFAGAVTVGRFARRISPLFTYPLAFVLLGLSMWAVFGTRGAANPDAQLASAVRRYEDERSRPGSPEAPVPALAQRPADAGPAWDEERLERRDAANLGRAYGLLAWLVLLGVGGGLLLGRVDADLLTLVSEELRGRVFAVKGFIFTCALMTPLLLFALSGDFAVRWDVALFLPRALLFAAAPVAALAWMVDRGLYGDAKQIAEPGWQERALYHVARFLLRVFCQIYFRYEVLGADKIPRTGPVLLAANHGSFLDPVWLGISTRRRVQYMMHASYYRSFAHPLFRFATTIPVESGESLSAIKAGARALNNGLCLGIFPEGTVTRTGKLSPPKSGALFIAQRTGALVVPVAILGNLRAFPRPARFPRPTKITVVVGDPFTVPKTASRAELERLADELMAGLAAKLGLEPPPCAEARKNRSIP